MKTLCIKTFLVILFIPFFSPGAYSQKAIELIKNNNKIILPVGKRVKYELNNGFMEVGRIQSINDSSLTINSRVVRISDLNKIGRKSPGSNFRGIFLTSFGGIFALSIIKNLNTETPACPQCQTTTTTDDSVVPGIIVGVALSSIGIVVLSRNSTKDLSNGWTMKIVDLPKQ